MNGCTIYIHSEAMFVKARGGAASWLVPKCCVLWTQNCSRRRRSQCCFSSISEQAMHESIERSQLRKKKKLSDRVGCPGCSQKSLAPKSLLSHMTRCCPDLIHDQHEWVQALAQPIQKHKVQSLLQAAEAAQRQAQNRVLHLTFRQVDTSGAPTRRSPGEVALQLSLPVDRCERLLRAGIKATPMPGDLEPVEVLWEDEYLVAVNKPPHLNSTPVHRHVGNSMVNRLITYLGQVPKVLHRLDMDTSGVLLFGKDAKVTAEMHKLFRTRDITKQYIAICTGTPSTADSGRFSEYIEGSVPQHMQCMAVNAPLGRHPAIGPAACVHVSGKYARTILTVLDTSERVAWGGERGEAWFQEQLHPMQGACVLQCQPLTGRTHQIRLHLAAAGMPIVGDNLYGLKVAEVDRQCLHASALTFQHPVDGREVNVNAPVPPDMRQILSKYELFLQDM